MDEIKKLKALLAILNSKLADFWFNHMGKRKGKALELFSEPINCFPINKLIENDDTIDVLSIFSEYMLFLCFEEQNNLTNINEIKQINEIIDIIVFEIYLCNKTDFVNRIANILTDKTLEFERWSYLSRKHIISQNLPLDEKNELLLLKDKFKVIIKGNYKRIVEDEICNLLQKKICSSKLLENLTISNI